MVMRLIDMTGAGTGVAVAFAQAIPGVPDDFKSWPATAVLGFITLSALIAGVIERRMAAKALSELAAGVTSLAIEQRVSNTRQDELAKKIGETNDMHLETLTNLKARPCIAEDLEEALRKMKKTQRIS